MRKATRPTAIWQAVGRRGGVEEPTPVWKLQTREPGEPVVFPVAIQLGTVSERQNRFVAPNAVSPAQALFSPEAWYRAVYHGEELVGFVMLSDESLIEPMPENPTIGVWRFMVDARHQRKGIGRAAMQLIIQHVRSNGLFRTLELSYVPGDGGPEQLYRSLGFRPTGAVDDGEVVMELPLDAGASD